MTEKKWLEKLLLSVSTFSGRWIFGESEYEVKDLEISFHRTIYACIPLKYLHTPKTYGFAPNSVDLPSQSLGWLFLLCLPSDVWGPWPSFLGSLHSLLQAMSSLNDLSPSASSAVNKLELLNIHLWSWFLHALSVFLRKTFFLE